MVQQERALAFQPYFDFGFPHGYNQWVSAVTTSRATMALTFALPERELLTALSPLVVLAHMVLNRRGGLPVILRPAACGSMRGSNPKSTH